MPVSGREGIEAMTSPVSDPYGAPRPGLSLLDLPEDPLDAQALAALPHRTLQALTDRIYQQLDSEYPSAYTLEWYSAVTKEWARRGRAGSRIRRNGEP